MNVKFDANFDKAMGSAVAILRKVDNHVGIDLTDSDVKFVKMYCMDADVNNDIASIVNCNYYPEGWDEAYKFVSDIIRVIRKEPKTVRKIEPNRHIRVRPFFEC